MRYLTMLIAFILIFPMAGCLDEEQSPSYSPSHVTQRPDMIKMHDTALNIVKEGLKDSNGLIQTHAIEVVATCKRLELMPYITEKLRSGSVPVRFAAATAIGDVRYTPSEFAVKQLLNDEDHNVRIAAAYALAKLGKIETSDVVRKGLESNDQTVRANAAMLLGKLGSYRDVELLKGVLRKEDSTDKVKLQSVESMAMLGDRSVFRDKLWPLLISKYADDRLMGIFGMSALGTRDAKNAILSMLHDDVAEVRLAAAGELGKLGDRSGKPEVESYLQNKSGGVTEQGNQFAAVAIGQIKDRSLAKYLPELMRSTSKPLRLSAAKSALLLE
ncbi:MAG: HEAT repeat domain-containing protein [Sedimentisphaerales bacterium]|nr:HEAT repeat domain-containing protein [Sedimentisphaerales bacterium]